MLQNRLRNYVFETPARARASVTSHYDISEQALFYLDRVYRSYSCAMFERPDVLGELAETEGLVLATDRIAYWAHWITPEGMPKRYDTRFFLAEAPPLQTAVHDDGELTTSAWVRPADAIAHALDRDWMIILPTLKNLEQLARFDSARSAMEAARGQTEVTCMVPRVLERDGEARIVLPGDDGYDEARRDASGFGPKVWDPERLVASGVLSPPGASGPQDRTG